MKLLSDEDLYQAFKDILASKYAGNIIDDRLIPLVNNQKQAHGNMVIGEDEHYSKNNSLYELSGEPFNWAERNQLRAEQRLRNQTGDKS